MTEIYFPFENGANAYVDEGRWLKFSKYWQRNGVVYGYNNGLALTPSAAASTFTIGTGCALINGFFYENTAVSNVFIIASNTSGLPRYDSVILRVDRTNAATTGSIIEIDVLQGTPGASPALPTLTQTDTIYEMRLYNIYLASGYTGPLSAATVTDVRTYCNLSGFSAIIGNGDVSLSIGLKGYIQVPFDCVLEGWTLVADTAGSATLDIWKDSYANFPPTVADTLIDASAGGEKPALATAVKAYDYTLTGWDKNLSRGDWLAINMDTVSGLKTATLAFLVSY